jgi:hypothetical protein
VPDVIAGSGLYLLHAFGADGKDRPGFPKLSGGWIMQSPCAGDIDNDKLNEVACVTREGWIFVWDTPGKYSSVPAWPGTGHDNFSSSNSGTDAVAPASVTDIEAFDGGIRFSCPGDDGYDGLARKVLIYGSDDPIDAETVKSAELVSEAAPLKGGQEMSVNIEKGYRYYAVVAIDEAGNSSQLPLTAAEIPVTPEAEIDAGQGSDSGSSGWCFISSSLL